MKRTYNNNDTFNNTNTTSLVCLEVPILCVFCVCVCVFCVWVWVRMCVTSTTLTIPHHLYDSKYVHERVCACGGINSDNSTECMIKTIINNNTNTENFTFPHHLYVSKYKYTNVCAWACMCMWGKYVCVWRTMRRDWLHDAMERRLLALALGSASWLLLLEGSSLLHPSDATMRCEGWRLMGRSCGWKIHLDPSLGSSPLPPYPNQHQSTTTSRDISRVVLRSLENVMSGVTLHGCLWCWAILYV